MIAQGLQSEMREHWGDIHNAAAGVADLRTARIGHRA